MNCIICGSPTYHYVCVRCEYKAKSYDKLVESLKLALTNSWDGPLPDEIRAKIQKNCNYCGGSGSVETELYEGLVSCPECDPHD